MRAKTHKVPVAVTVPQLEQMDKLIEKGVFPDRNELTRTAIRDLLKSYSIGIEA